MPRRRGGVLVEVETAPLERLPYEPASFDVAIARGHGPGEVTTPLAEVLRVLRPGGRCLVIAPAGPSRAIGPVEAFKAARLPRRTPHRRLAAGLAFYEAVKSGQS